MRYASNLSAVCVLLAWVCVASAQHHEHEHGHGKIDFTISCNEEASKQFEHALGLLHHMMYDQALPYFEAAAEADRSCAMAHWGIAMTQLRPLWYPPTEHQFETGRSAIHRAIALNPPTERERRYIGTLEAYYATAENDGHRAGLKAWDSALEELRQASPDDIDAGAFWALAHTATASRADKTYAQQKRAGALLEELLARAPEHPGLFHYLIHAYDSPALASHAIDVARRYDKLAPDVPHALHMPSHIFVRVGLWPDVISWNRRSADAALRQPVGELTSQHHTHALDYLMYAYLQQGRDREALAAWEEIKSIRRYLADLSSAYGIAAAQARYPLERRQWADAAELPLRVHSEYPWDDFPQFEAITYWARGMGAARSGDVASARQAVEKLRTFHQQTLEKDLGDWALHVDVQRRSVEAWIAFAEGDRRRALELMKEAADLEDSVDKHPVTPSAVLPARELLGDMLMLTDRPAEAIEAYQTALAISPNRLNSLFGVAQAAEASGRPDVAKAFYTKIAELTASDSDRETVLRAKQYLAAN